MVEEMKASITLSYEAEADDDPEVTRQLARDDFDAICLFLIERGRRLIATSEAQE